MRRGMCSCWPLPSQAETCFPLSRIHFGLDAVYKKCSLANLVRNRNVRDAEWMGSSGLTKFSDSITFCKSFRTHTLHYTVDMNLGVCWEYGVAEIISQGMWWVFCPRRHLAPGDTFDCGQGKTLTFPTGQSCCWTFPIPEKEHHITRSLQLDLGSIPTLFYTRIALFIHKLRFSPPPEVSCSTRILWLKKKWQMLP